MATILREEDASSAALGDTPVGIVGYGNQGRSWALNLRDSGLDVRVYVRADASRDQARADGFKASDIREAADAAVLCLLVPDDVIPSLSIDRPADGLTIVASGYTLAFGRFAPAGDVAMIAPRMLGPEVRQCYQDGTGFITAVGVHHDATGTARARMLAVAGALGGLRRGAIQLTAHQEATLDLAVEQILSPALTRVNGAFVATMLGEGIPLEAIMTELYLSGEVERNYRLLREVGFVGQLGLHSPTSQYGQLSRRGRFDHLDLETTMTELTADITSGRFADEWDAEGAAGYPELDRLRDEHAGPDIAELESTIRKAFDPEPKS